MFRFRPLVANSVLHKLCDALLRKRNGVIVSRAQKENAACSRRSVRTGAALTRSTRNAVSRPLSVCLSVCLTVCLSHHFSSAPWRFVRTSGGHYGFAQHVFIVTRGLEWVPTPGLSPVPCRQARSLGREAIDRGLRGFCLRPLVWKPSFVSGGECTTYQKRCNDGSCVSSSRKCSTYHYTISRVAWKGTNRAALLCSGARFVARDPIRTECAGLRGDKAWTRPQRNPAANLSSQCHLSFLSFPARVQHGVLVFIFCRSFSSDKTEFVPCRRRAVSVLQTQRVLQREAVLLRQLQV